VIYASALRLVVLKFLLSMSASADVLALASLEVGGALFKLNPVCPCSLKAPGDPTLGQCPLGFKSCR
jgi:hypothetical protein